jgi:multidrug efflux pump subunit AcrA (membrane-fusion protein)
MDFNSIPPGLAGFLAMQGHIDRRNQGTAQLGLGMLAADARRQEMALQQQRMQREDQLEPLRLQLLQAQVDQQREGVDQSRRKNDFYANIGQYMTPGGVVAPGTGETGGMDSGATGRIMEGPQTQLPSVDMDRLLMGAVGAGVVNPETLVHHQAQIQERQAARQQRMQELQIRLNDARTTAQEKMDLQRQLAQMQMDGRRELAVIAASNRESRGNKPPSGFQFKPDGTLEPIPGGPGDKSNDKIQSLRKEFNALKPVENYRTVVPIIQSIRNAKDNAAGDLDFIYAVGKILDPESVVREGEMNLVIKSGSPLERFKGEINNVMGNGRLTTKTRANLTQMLQSRVGEIKRGYDAAEAIYRKNAERMGLPTDEIFMDFGTVEIPSAPAPSAPANGGWSAKRKS